MKTILKTSLLVISLLVGVVANAQDTPLTFGVKAGVNLSNFGGDVKDSDAKVGFNVGLTVDYALTQDVFLMSGLEFTTKGAKSSYEEDFEVAKASVTETVNAMYLQLPIHIGYKFDVSEGVKLNIHAGPYLAYGIGGKAKIKYKGDIAGVDLSQENGEVDFFGKDRAKEFDFGLGLGVGAEFGKIGVGLGYDLGLVNLSRESDYKITNMNAYLSVGYKF